MPIASNMGFSLPLGLPISEGHNTQRRYSNRYQQPKFFLILNKMRSVCVRVGGGVNE